MVTYKIYTSSGYLFYETHSLWLAQNFVKRCPNLKFSIQGDNTSMRWTRSDLRLPK